MGTEGNGAGSAKTTRLSWRLRAMARRAWRSLDATGPLIGIRVSMTAPPPVRPLPRHGRLVTDGDVLRALTRLHQASGWERLEIAIGPRTVHDPADPLLISGYCAGPSGRNVETGDALARPGTPEVIKLLHALLLDSGWRRLEAVSDCRGGTGGFCERADGSGVRYPGARDSGIMRLSTSPGDPGRDGDR